MTAGRRRKAAIESGLTLPKKLQILLTESLNNHPSIPTTLTPK